MAKILTKNEEMEKFANEVIEAERLLVSYKPKIGYLTVHPMISKTVVARCIKANNELKFYSDFDYIIEFSEDLYDVLDERMKKLVLFHELLHICPVNNEKTGNYDFRLIDHDLKDFYQIVSKHGINWFGELKAQVASHRELDPLQQDLISL